jgi:Domain of unknown function (DUF4276)
MVTKIKIYIEGGGKDKDGKARIREGMTKFLEKATSHSGKFQVICCGSRNEALNMFRAALGKPNENPNYIFLLVDSEAFVKDADDGTKRPKQHLQTRDPSWDMQGMNEQKIHLMAQVMESWFIADVDALANFYGQNFNRNAIPPNMNVEEIEKSRIETALVEATKNTTKGKYHKIQHGAKILAIINPTVVRDKASYCQRFFKAIAP